MSYKEGMSGGRPILLIKKHSICLVFGGSSPLAAARKKATKAPSILIMGLPIFLLDVLSISIGPDSMRLDRSILARR
jgi:hypothetical protein